jgi:hypothetical protein
VIWWVLPVVDGIADLVIDGSLMAEAVDVKWLVAVT